MILSFREFVQSGGVDASANLQKFQAQAQQNKPLKPVLTQSDQQKDPALDPAQWGKGGKVNMMKPVRDVADRFLKTFPKSPASQQLKQMMTQLDANLAKAAQGHVQWTMRQKSNQASQGQNPMLNAGTNG
jgi:hypothetical protein